MNEAESTEGPSGGERSEEWVWVPRSPGYIPKLATSRKTIQQAKPPAESVS